jgi:serine/threonine protein kinase
MKKTVKNMDEFPEIPGCKILSELGEGGAAKVYLGIQENLNRKVAIKVLHPHLLKNKEIAERFKKEAKAAANLSHSSIVQIFDIGKAGNYHYIVMEYLEDSLRERLERDPERKMPPELALSIVEKIMQALDYAHLRGVYHRDLKPDNIMFKHDNTPVIVDFGIARVYNSTDQLTGTGSFMGTVYYMSPEQCRSKQVDGRSDIYSLGVIIYEMLTGKKPYTAESMIAVALMHIEEEVPKLPTALKYYQPLIDKMMAKDKEDRIASYPEFEGLVDRMPKGPVTGEYEVLIDTNEPFKIQDSDKIPTPKSNPISDKIKASYLSLTDQLKDVKQTSKKYLDLLKENQWSFLKTMKKKLWPLIKKIKEKLISFKNFLVHGKVPVWILLLVIIIGMGLIMHFNAKPKNPPLPMPKHVQKTTQPGMTQSKMTQSIISSFLSKLLESMTDYYQQKLQPLNKLYKGGLNSIKKGLRLINELKKIKILLPALNEWERKFANRRDQLEREYQKHLLAAKINYEQENYPKAKENLQEAKKIYPTKELETFEKGLIKAKEGYKKVQTQLGEMKDDQAYILARITNTIDAYSKYVDEYPTGRYVKKVKWKINQLKVEPFIKNKEFINVSNMQSMIKQHGFFETRLNKTGTFKSNYEKTMGNSVVIDHTTGLMWYNEKPPQKMDFQEATQWIDDLNNNKYRGYNDWRLPSLEEAASLLRKNKNNHELHMDAILSGHQKIIWTQDRFSVHSFWVVDFTSGTVEISNEDKQYNPRPVRSME